MNSNRCGFSLIEVLIAFAILSLVLAALVPGQARLFGRGAAIEQRLLAHDLALSILDRRVISKELAHGLSEERHGDWRAKTEIHETNLVGSEARALRVKIVVETSAGLQLTDLERVVIVE